MGESKHPPAAPSQSGVEMWRDPVVEAYKSGVDRTLLRENLRLTVEERWRKLMDLQRLAAELQRAARARRAEASTHTVKGKP